MQDGITEENPQQTETPKSHGFEMAQEQMETAINQEANPETPQEEKSAEEQAIDEIMNLDSQEKFKFNDHEFTPDSLNEAIMLKQDYTKKTQEFSQEKQYWENLHYDLDSIKNDPKNVEAFKRIYPEKFHKYADDAARASKLAGSDSQNSTQPQNNEPEVVSQLREEISSLKNRLDERDQVSRDQQVKQTQEQVDILFDNMLKKYPLANEQEVEAQAMSMIDKNKEQNPYFKMTNAAWERMFKASHERTEQRASGFLNDRLKAQINKGNQGADGGAGGSAPGRGGKPKTISEATDSMLAHFGG